MIGPCTQTPRRLDRRAGLGFPARPVSDSLLAARRLKCFGHVVSAGSSGYPLPFDKVTGEAAVLVMSRCVVAEASRPTYVVRPAIYNAVVTLRARRFGGVSEAGGCGRNHSGHTPSQEGEVDGQ